MMPLKLKNLGCCSRFTMNTMKIDNNQLLRFTTAGSVDDGKSTLIGRLLYDSKSIFEDQLDAVEITSKRKIFFSIFNLNDFDKTKQQELLKQAEEESSKPEINDQSKYLVDQKIEVLKSIN